MRALLVLALAAFPALIAAHVDAEHLELAMVFPRTSSFNNVEIAAALHFGYTCTLDACAFDETFHLAEQSDEFPSAQIAELSVASVRAIVAGWARFTPHGFDGIWLQWAGMPYLYVQNTSPQHAPSGRVMLVSMDSLVRQQASAARRWWRNLGLSACIGLSMAYVVAPRIQARMK